MAGRHLRPAHRPAVRMVLWVIVALVVGVVLGAGAVFLFEDEPARVDAGGAVAPAVSRAMAGAGAPGGTATADPDPGPITLAFVGDVYAEYGLRTRLTEDPATFVGPFATVLSEADLAVANLEATIVEGGEPVDKEFVFSAPPSILDALAAGGIDVVSVANNHGFDYGADGLAQTLAAKQARADGMVIGVGADEDEAYAPFVRSVGGHTVAVLAATQVLDGDRISASTAGPDEPGLASAKRLDRLVAEVAAARRTADTVVVFLHWGVETETCPSAGQRELAAALVDAGADVIVGAHAHRVQGGGRMGGALVHYGLGNFLFGAVSEASATSGVLLVEVDGRDVVDYEWRPGRIRDAVPEPLEGAEADEAVAAWEDLRDCTDLSR